MIHPDSRYVEWINSIATLHPSLDKTLIEKTIRAFSLLESLFYWWQVDKVLAPKSNE